MLQIYPEGELIDGCRTLRAFQPGAFQIACWFRKPMIPCLLRFYPRFSKSGRRKRDGMELVILEHRWTCRPIKRANARQQSWKRKSDVRWKRHGLQLVERVHEDCAFYCLDRAGKSCGNGAESENYLAWYGEQFVWKRTVRQFYSTRLYSWSVGEIRTVWMTFHRIQTICVTHGHLDHLMEVPEFLDPESDAEATVSSAEKWRQRRFPIWWRTPAT